MVEPEGADDGISRQPGACVSTRLSSLHVFHLSFARQGRNHYTFYLDTPYLSFTLLSASSPPQSLTVGGNEQSPLGDFFFYLVGFVAGEVDDAWITMSKAHT